MIGERRFRKMVLCKTFILPMNIPAAGDLFGTRKGGKERFWGHPTRSGRGAQRQDAKKEASGIHVGEKQPAIPANLRLDNSFDGLEMFH